MRHPEQPELAQIVADFEGAVLAQERVAAEHYDEQYFASGWRADDNRYDLATRRRVEARNPQLIHDVFAPSRVLDIGCGPGFLMQFLHERGIDVHGVDFADASRDLAPPEMRDRIRIAAVTDPQVEAAAFDLVICREVLEHLTVPEVQQTVREICRASSRYAYVTTRFHPEPASILDFTTQFDVDPSHITLLAKDLVRVLFILQGFRRRSDLEARMDWRNLNRVLVYERATA